MTKTSGALTFEEIQDEFGRAGELKAAVARAEFQLGRALIEMAEAAHPTTAQIAGLRPCDSLQ